MMTLYALKPAFQNRLRPAVMRLARAGVTANQVTLAAIAGSVAVGALAAALAVPAAFLLIPVWLGLRMALNAADGMLARECGQKSRLGAYLNEIGDVVSDAALTLPFWFVPAIGPAPVAAAIALAILAELAGVLGPAIGASRRYDGPMARATGRSPSGPSRPGSGSACRPARGLPPSCGSSRRSSSSPPSTACARASARRTLRASRHEHDSPRLRVRGPAPGRGAQLHDP